MHDERGFTVPASRPISTWPSWVTLAAGGLILVATVIELVRARNKPGKVRLKARKTAAAFLLLAIAALLNAIPRVAGAPDGLDLAASVLALIAIVAAVVVLANRRRVRRDD